MVKSIKVKIYKKIKLKLGLIKYNLIRKWTEQHKNEYLKQWAIVTVNYWL